VFRYGVDARYAGQGNEITIWVGEGDSWPATAAEVTASFEVEYRRIYGMAIPDVAVEAITWRLSASATTSVVEPDDSIAPHVGEVTPKSVRPMVFARGVDAVDAPVYDRAALGAGAKFAGPAVVEERETTSVIRPGWHVEVAADGSLIASKQAS
jgi:N-methylhydantoinase A